MKARVLIVLGHSVDLINAFTVLILMATVTTSVTLFWQAAVGGGWKPA